MKAKTRKAATAQKPIDERQRLYELLLKWSKPIVWEDFARRGTYKTKCQEIADAFGKEAERGNQLEWVPGTAKGNLDHAIGLVEIYQDEIAEIEKLLGKLRPDLTAEFIRALEMLVASDAARSAERIERILDKFVAAKTPAESLMAAPPWPSDETEEVFSLLNALPAGKGLKGKQILSALNRQKEMNIDHSVLTSRIIPFLKKHYHVKPSAGGYYVEKPA